MKESCLQILLASNEFWMEPSLQEYVNLRIRCSFTALKRKAISIAVRLCDLNGPSGGRETMCQISVSTPGQPEILVKHVQEDMYAAIDMAARRATHRANRILLCKRSRVLKSVRTKFQIGD
jgi:putative sigma-54 modulation protein